MSLDLQTYFDHAATSPLDEEVRQAMLEVLAAPSNPSSRHGLGVAAAEQLDLARRRVARACAVEPRDVTFTSGGTEANNLGLMGALTARSAREGRVLFGAGDHPSVREAATATCLEHGLDAVELALDAHGGLDLVELEGQLGTDTQLVSVLLVSNELGSIAPLRQITRLVRRSAPDAHVHVDAVQALGKLELGIEELGLRDVRSATLALSAHKVHGPAGAGALVHIGAPGIAPLMHGGGQEAGLRSGTENVAACAGFGLAARKAADTVQEHAAAASSARATLEAGLEQIAGATTLIAHDAGSAWPGICAVELPGAPAEVWQHHLEQRGVYVSVGSACQSNKEGVSPALLALGLPVKRARQVARLSFSRATSSSAVELALSHLVEVGATLQGASA